MTFILSAENVFQYLIEQKLCSKEQVPLQIKPKLCKNFNLLVTLPNTQYFLVKQEPHAGEEASDGLINEWRIQEFLQKFPEASYIQRLISEAIHFDSQRSIIVFNYLNDYCDLSDFYTKECIFPVTIASAIGASLATVHRTTIDSKQYKNFFSRECEDPSMDIPNFLGGLERIEPEIFGVVSADNLKFFELFQRYDSLTQAIAQLNTTFESCCLMHNDLKLNNILLHNEWEQVLLEAEQSSNIVRLIDWESCTWGDPAYDLGTIIASYLKIWLESLAISTAIDVESALRLAITPLEQLQPSITALTKAYLDNFPEIMQRRPDFLKSVVQFSGYGLIEKIKARIQYQEPFGNTGICMLQVAKTLLCRPMQSIPTVFGTTASELSCISRLSA